MKIRPFFLLLFCVFFCCPAIFAAEPEAIGKIAKIEVVGNERIEKGVITNVIKSRVNQPYDLDKIREDMKSIYRTGFFSDVQIDVQDAKEGQIITFVVVERPPISAIYIQGNKKITTNDIRDKLKIKNNTVLNTEKLKESVDEVKKLYASKGYYSSKVNYEIDYEEGYRAQVRFLVDESEKAYIRKITFTGNAHMKSSRLTDVMRTREKGWLSWFTGSGVLDEEALDDDRKVLESQYQDNGYVRAKIGVPNIQLSKDGKAISIAIPVDEGNIYKVGSVDFKGDVIFPEQELRKQLRSKQGNTFRSSLFQGDVVQLTDMYQDKGYAFVDIAPLTAIDDENRTVNVTFDVAKGKEVYFNRINILGNIKTHDKVVRRELRFAEGDRYSSMALKYTKRRLRNTTFFKDVDLKLIRTDEPDKVNVDVAVEERPTGSLSLGLGYSTYYQAMISGSISQDNFLGTGRRIVLDASISSIYQQFNFIVVEPYLFDRDISGSLNLFDTRRIFDTYDYTSVGGSTTFSRPMTEFIRGALRYKYEIVDVSNIDASASTYVQDQSGSRSTSSVAASLIQTTIDDILNPSSGVTASASLELAGGPFFGDNEFVKAIASYGRYFPFRFGSAFFLRATAGTVRPYGGQPIPIYEKFFVGGITSVRGFKYGYAGPRDSNGDVIGGDNQLIFNSEWIFPIYRPAGLKGVVFFDAGHGFDAVSDWFSDMRYGAGFGIRWFSPMGPIRLELGFNLKPRQGEQTSVFDFTMGRSF